MRQTLRQIRRMKEVSQDKMAEVLGVHVQTYRKLELNPDLLEVRQAKQVADFLEVDYDTIFFIADSALSRKHRSQLQQTGS